ncbi:MAG: GHKL domain-containing protein [Flavobacteriia bacterium]|nr:GHKL domain-containing protein [Flavobacteriia bacterium]
MIQFLKKYYRFVFAILFSLFFIASYIQVFSVNYIPSIQQFKKEFRHLENELNDQLKDQYTKIQRNKELKLWSKYSLDEDINFHVYRNDSLVFWNTNHLPILRFADIHFPSDGMVHLQNGWYYAKTMKYKNYVLCASFLIKNDYPYENKSLINDFSTHFSLPFSAYIVLEQETGFPIYSKNRDYLFSILPNEYQLSKGTESVVLMFLLVAAIGCWLISLAHFNRKMKSKYNWIVPFVLIGLRVISIKLVWFGFMHESESFSSSLYGTNEWFPNFFEYIINCFIITYTVLFVKNKIIELKLLKQSIYYAFGSILISFLLWMLILFLNKGLIENSSIPLVVDKLFSLNEYSVIAIASMGLLFYVFFQYALETIQAIYKYQVKHTILLLFTTFLGVIYFIYEYYFCFKLFYAALFPALFLIILISSVYKEKKQYRIGYGLIFLFLFAFISTINLTEFNQRKERGERELYANQLASEKDIVSEIEFSNVVSKITSDPFLQKFIAAPYAIGLSDFEDGMERRIFNGFWERYEMGFNLFDANSNSLIISKSNKEDDFKELNSIIEKHGSASEIDSNLFYINDYTGHYSYIAKQPLYKADSSIIYLFCTFRSKKIPEEIGFPRLLISSKAKVFEPLENYSIAKYYESHLVTKYGKFNYPSSDLALNNWKQLKTGYYNSDGYSHYVLQKTKSDVIVLSAQRATWLEFITSFSYLFTFFGILLLPALYHFKFSEIFSNTLTLALKIQIVLIGLVFISLLAFGWGSGVFVSNQYNEFTNDVIREKLNSVEAEMKDKLGTQNELKIQDQGNYIELLLQNFAKVFVTDINLYDHKGYIIATSRPKVFNIGLLSEQMNADAFFQVDIRDKSEFIHQENIGSLKYTSAYTPFYNNEGKLLAYLNLQHFGQQKDFEYQIQHFLVAIINVFMLLLAISIIIAIFVSSWVTSPLRLLQESFSNVKFGKHNQQILYNKKDEIGALVKDYNQKLEELEFTAQQLAKSERETAWREMAKQVAHEIKNPLTPMKLSIQQLQRVYDPNDINSKAKLDKVAFSIIEQIDALTKIANEFSTFAKMPRPNEAKFDLKPLIENVIEVFKDDENISISFTSAVHVCNVLADKDLMLRVFNNLIKNAIQAIPSDRKGNIEVILKSNELNYLIAISDNGKGISDETKDKIFVPYFTTKGTGTGLGLAMVKQIVENHRGSIWFESVENEGTVFYVEIPKG